MPKIYKGEYIAESAVIGEGTKIGAGHDIGEFVKIGKNCNIQCHVTISNGWIIEDEVFIGPGVNFANDKYMNGVETHGRVEKGARIGLSSSIGAGVRIGARSRIGQHSNVIHHIPPNVWAWGNPAKIKRILTPEEVSEKSFWVIE